MRRVRPTCEQTEAWGNVVEQCEADLFMADLLHAGGCARTSSIGRRWSDATEDADEADPGPMIVQTHSRSGFFRVPRMASHYFARGPNRTWGQLALILFLVRLSARWGVRAPDHPFALGDLAEEDGRHMRDHASHDTGLAVDIYVFNKQGKRRAGTTNVTLVGGAEYDQERTRELALLIKEVVESGFPVQEAWFNDPEINAAVGSVAGSSAPLLRTDGFRCDRKPAAERAACNRTMHHDHIHVLLRGTHPHSADHVAALRRLAWSLD